MDGDFKGDFTRDTFNPLKGFSRVLMQQGRVQIDADWNEQADILLYLLRRLTKDVIGSQGAPEAKEGFQINGVTQNANGVDFTISSGDYYVDGILIENEGTVDGEGQPTLWHYKSQPYWSASVASQAEPFLVYLDVWERQVSFIEDNSIREVALGLTGPDTATRAQLIWQVKILTQGDLPTSTQIKLQEFFNSLNPTDTHGFLLISDLRDGDPRNLTPFHDATQDPLRLGNPGKLRARAKVNVPDDACNIPPDAQFRGAENQFYRVEIQNGGPAWQPGTQASSSARKPQGGSPGTASPGATFKWSRENGSVVFSIEAIGDKTVTLSHLGRDDRSTLKEGDWVELVDDTKVFQFLGNPDSRPYPADPLLQVQHIDRMTRVVTLSDAPAIAIDQHPLLRRWNQQDREVKKDGGFDFFDAESGAMKVVEGHGEIGNDGTGEETNWITLEDGVQIQFQQSSSSDPVFYRPGDYWLIPARVITKDVEWPEQDDGTHIPLPPHGIKHHIAALALVNGQVTTNAPVTFKSLVQITQGK